MDFPLTKPERLILWQQCEILKKLYPDQEDSYQRQQRALESGYEQEWGHTYGQLISEPVRTSLTKEVWAIMGMFISVEESAEKIGYTGSGPTNFAGFDQQHEHTQYAFARYLVSEPGRFERWKKHPTGLNSHHEVLGRYRAMLSEYRAMGEPMVLTQAQLDKLMQADE